MIRVTRTLAAVAVAGTIVSAPLTMSSAAWAAGDGLVNVTISNNTTTVPIAAAVQNCFPITANVALLVKKVDQKGGQFTCTNKAGQLVLITDNKK